MADRKQREMNAGFQGLPPFTIFNQSDILREGVTHIGERSFLVVKPLGNSLSYA